MLQLIEQLRAISTKHNLKLAPEKSFFMLLKVRFLGHEIVPIANEQPKYYQVNDINTLFSTQRCSYIPSSDISEPIPQTNCTLQ